MSRVEKIVLDEKNKLLFIRPKTDNSFSTYRPSKLRPSKNGRESNSRCELNSVPNDVTHTQRHRDTRAKNLDTEHRDTQTSDSHRKRHTTLSVKLGLFVYRLETWKITHNAGNVVVKDGNKRRIVAQLMHA